MRPQKIDRVDYMDEMSKDESVVFKKFLELYEKNSEKIYLFLEGDGDIDYYQHIFDNHFEAAGISWLELVCHGRSKILDLIKDLSEHTIPEYKNCLHYGFIDKDYYEVENNPYPDRVYVTPCYSIENFYASEQFFKKILKRKFFVGENNQKNNDFYYCLQNFIERRNEFIKLILTLDSCLRCNHIMFEQGRLPLKINARDIKIKDLFSIDLDSVQVKPAYLDLINGIVKLLEDPFLSESKSFYNGKSYEELSCYIRGKFILDFIWKYLCRLKEDNHKAEPQLFRDSCKNDKLKGGGKIKFYRTKLSINKENHDLISDFSKYTTTPSCLNIFLRKIVSLKGET